MRKLIQSLFCLSILLAALIGYGASASGHAEYDHSDPAADAQLTVAPTQVRIWFTQELFRRAGMNGLEVYGADGSRVDQGEPMIDDDDRTLLSVSLLAPLPDGSYTVRWQATSAEDGHTAEGEFAFQVNSSGEGNTVATALPAPTDTAVPVVPTATIAPAPTAPPAGALGGNCALGAAPFLLLMATVWGQRRKHNPTVAETAAQP